ASESKGKIIAVSDEEILSAQKILAGEGVWVETASAMRPATPAAEAGSTQTPSPANIFCADKISSSDTAIIFPLDSLAASSACSPRAGLPILMAVATVSGLSTG